MDLQLYAFIRTHGFGQEERVCVERIMEQGDRISRIKDDALREPRTDDAALFARNPLAKFILINGWEGSSVGEAINVLRGYGYTGDLYFHHDRDWLGDGLGMKKEDEGSMAKVMHPHFSRPLPLPGKTGRD